MVMNQENCVHKVAAFITRDDDSGKQMLVFRHPTAGIQVPAGTVEEHETWRHAVVRETREETGLERASIVRHLARFTEQLAPHRAVLNRTIPWTSAGQQSDDQPNATRGQIVRVLRGEGAEVLVSHDEYGMVDGKLVVESSTQAWVPNEALSPCIERHLVHLTSDDASRSAWRRTADRGHDFEVYWAHLTDLTLVEGQEAWLRRVVDEIIA